MFDNIFNILADNLTFIIIGVIVIGILIFAYFAFVRIGPYETKDNTPKNLEDESNTIKESPDLNENTKEDSVQPSMIKDELEMDKTKETTTSNNNHLHVDDLLDDSKDHSEKPEKTKTKEKAEVKKTPDEKDKTEKDDEPKKAPENESNNQSSTGSNELGKYHILYRDKDEKWYVKREGSDKVIRVLHTKKEAVAYATIKAINQDTDIVIHKKDGKIEKHGYM